MKKPRGAVKRDPGPLAPAISAGARAAPSLLRTRGHCEILNWQMKTIRGDAWRDRSAAALFGLFALALFIYEVMRALRLSLTFDEAATYLTYLSSNIFSLFDLRSANNHFFYSLLARLASFSGGSSEFVLRLPSLLGFGLFL